MVKIQPKIHSSTSTSSQFLLAFSCAPWSTEQKHPMTWIYVQLNLYKSEYFHKSEVLIASSWEGSSCPRLILLSPSDLQLLPSRSPGWEARMRIRPVFGYILPWISLQWNWRCLEDVSISWVVYYGYVDIWYCSKLYSAVYSYKYDCII